MPPDTFTHLLTQPHQVLLAALIPDAEHGDIAERPDDGRSGRGTACAFDGRMPSQIDTTEPPGGCQLGERDLRSPVRRVCLRRW